jgi:hypothetical protein
VPTLGFWCFSAGTGLIGKEGLGSIWPFAKPRMNDRCLRISFSNGSRREALRGVDAFGCLRSLRARSALDGVSWVQRGLVEIAVGPRLTACYEIRAVVCSLPRASLLLGAGFGLLSRGLRGLGERELRSVSQHRVHNDREATSQSDPSLSHR